MSHTALSINIPVRLSSVCLLESDDFMVYILTIEKFAWYCLSSMEQLDASVIGAWDIHMLPETDSQDLLVTSYLR
jgi:hypothetical protein